MQVAATHNASRNLGDDIERTVADRIGPVQPQGYPDRGRLIVESKVAATALLGRSGAFEMDRRRRGARSWRPQWRGPRAGRGVEGRLAAEDGQEFLLGPARPALLSVRPIVPELC